MSRRFRFPLQTLLTMRERQERAAQREVGAVLADIARLEQANADARRDIRDRQRELTDTQSAERVMPQELAAGRAWLAALRAGIARRQQEIAARQVTLAERQAALIEARRRKRVIEKLRERRLETHQRDAVRREQAVADETAQHLLLRLRSAPDQADAT